MTKVTEGQQGGSGATQKFQGMELTAREMQCITLAMQNKSLQEIGAALQIEPRTVYFYLTNIKSKVVRLANQALDKKKKVECGVE